MTPLRTSFDPLQYPALFEEPERLSTFSVWRGHIPFALFLMTAIRPRLFVELGTHFGDSYCAFCQSAATLPEPPHCVSVDTWGGDEHAGFYGEEIYNDLRDHHDSRYAAFSELRRMTFDNALPSFADGTIDLLHIDGLHTYEAVKLDFDSYRPKLSDSAVVLLHDTAERGGDFGVYRFWDELKSSGLSHFEFVHAGGLGVVAVGAEVPDALVSFFQADAVQTEKWRFLFQRLGERWAREGDLKKVVEDLGWTQGQLREVQDYAAALVTRGEESEIHRADLQKYLEEVDADRQHLREEYEKSLARLGRIERSAAFRVLARLGATGKG